MLKDLGHSTYSFGKSLLNEDNYIDASGLVVLRHAIGEVNLLFFTISFRYSSGAQCRAQDVMHKMLGAMWGATC